MASRFNCPTDTASKPGPGNYLANKLKLKGAHKPEKLNLGLLFL